MSTSDTVEALLSLQDIDEEIRERESALDELTPDVEEAEERVKEIRGRLKEARGQLEEAESRRRSDQRSVEAGRETLRRLRERAEEVESMKQHQAVRSELATARRNLDQAEEQALDSMQRVEDLEERVAGIEEELEEAEATHDELAERVEARRRELEEEIERRRELRASRVGSIDDEIVELYERVRKGKTREVLAPLDGGHCGHCYTMVPPQRQNEIRSSGRLYRCEECGVILHAADAVEG